MIDDMIKEYSTCDTKIKFGTFSTLCFHYKNKNEKQTNRNHYQSFRCAKNQMCNS